MERSQSYIGSPNGVVVCMNAVEDGQMQGYFCCRYREQMEPFHNAGQLLERMERFFDEINFPRATTAMRSFGEERPAAFEGKERNAVMTDEELLKKHGELGTFIVRVQHRQHNSWQGRITWMEENRTLHFRSIWELVKLIESALNTKLDQDELEKEPHWFE